MQTVVWERAQVTDERELHISMGQPQSNNSVGAYPIVDERELHISSMAQSKVV